jgi:HlyD family secretion protein
MKIRDLNKSKISRVVFGLISIPVWLVFSFIKNNSTADAKLVTTTVEKEDLAAVVMLPGELGSKDKMDIFSSIDGKIEEILIKEGDFVKEGELLFKVKNIATEKERQKALEFYNKSKERLNLLLANHNRLNTQLRQVEDNLKKAENLLNDDEVKNFIPNDQKEVFENNSKKSIGAIKGNISQNWLLIEEARIQEKEARSAYEATLDIEIVAPMSGKIDYLNYKMGDLVLSTSGAEKVEALVKEGYGLDKLKLSKPLTTLSGSQDYYLRSVIEENRRDLVESGKKVKIQFREIQDKIYEANIVDIGEKRKEYEGEGFLDITVKISHPDDRLKSEMIGMVIIETEQLNDVITVPNQAVTYENGKAMVAVVSEDNKNKTFVPVEIGAKGLNKTQILEGLSEGLNIISFL